MHFKALFAPPGCWRVRTKTVVAMKLTFLLTVVAFFSGQAGGLSQNVSLSFKNASLESVFKSIEHQTSYVFFMRADVLEKGNPVSVDLRNVPLKEALDACFRGQPFTWSMEGRIIAVEPRAVVTSSLVVAPPGEVHGRITDSSGAPIVGASVIVKGTKKGTTTDANGNFALKDVPDNAILVISSVGYDTRETKPAGKNAIAIELHQTIVSMRDFVISKGYYNVTDRTNTGDISIVGSKEIEEQSVSDPILALEGRVPGLYISQTSGMPGAYENIRIMGQNSLINGTAPLYIVDGMPYNSTSLTSPDIGGGALGGPNPYGGGGGLSPFNLLDPADIESVEVLKDADATAIYGSRGANGVVLITTKKGKAGDTKVSVNLSEGVGHVTRMMSLLNTPQYLQMRHEAFANDGQTPSIGNGDYDLLAWDTTRYTNWQKLLIGNGAHYTNANLNVSGGNANTQFIFGGTYNRQGTVFPGNYSDQKTSGFFNLTHSSNNKRFNARFSASYLSDGNNMPNNDVTHQALQIAPDAPSLYNKDGSLNWAFYNGRTTWTNPVAYTVIDAEAKSANLISSLYLGYQLLPGLKIQSNFGYNMSLMDQNILQPASRFAPPTADINPNNRRNSLAHTEFNSWNIEPVLSYDKKISKGQLSILAGTTFQENQNNSQSYLARGFASDALIADPLSASVFSPLGVESAVYRYNAAYARLGYGWDDKYILNLTARRDGSSRFGPGKQFGDFGSIGAAWVFSKEKGFHDKLPWLSFGKLRASYGVTGNDQIGDYEYLSTYAPNSNSYQGITSLGPTSLANPYFAWERVRKLQGSADFSFFGDRINLTGTYYNNIDGNQLVSYTLPYITGFNGIQSNLPATVQNNGWEFILNTRNIVSHDFKWSTSFNLTIPHNRLVSFPNLQNSSYNYQFVVGKSIFGQYFYQYTGVNPKTGIYTFAGQDSSGNLNTSDRTFSRPITQSAFGGISNSFSYKGFQLDFTIQFVKQLGWNYISDYFNWPGLQSNNQPTYILNAWKKAGDVTSTEQYSQTYAQAAEAFQNLGSSDAAISDASFLRLKNLAFSYSLPTRLIQRATLKSVRVYFQGQNLLTVTKFKGLDPETSSSGATPTLPSLRMITFGLQAVF